MNQRSIFKSLPVDDKRIPKAWQLFIDGASRNNPGPAGVGIYLAQQGIAVIQQGFFLGTKTNNQAEYLALILGISQAKSIMMPVDSIAIFSDSQLLVRQVQGIYRIKNAELGVLHSKAMHVLAGLNYSLHHIKRSDNALADSLANMGIDKNIAVPQELHHLCY